MRGTEGDINLIKCLKNGGDLWASSSGFRISLVSLLGATGAALALAFKKDINFGNLINLSWLSERNSPHQNNPLLLPGLQNHGNNCFLNVILQALASCSHFLPFLQKIMDECEEEDDNLPLLTIALATLLEDLCSVREKRVVLSPRELMLAMELYVNNFSLTSQQDAAEAFLHLLSSLREEFTECYSPTHISLMEAFTGANCRFLSLQNKQDQSEQERWQKHFFGPFDGILGSILTCQSCSSQISLDYQAFHSLSLLPVLNGRSSIMIGCSLEDCLKQFLTAERIDNYRCSCCWHIAAIKYLTAIGVDEVEIRKIRKCTAQDSCDCQTLFHHKNLPWTNNFSHTFKKLSISRCPKILCIHLQRASIDVFGELFKLQGHIGFPSILDLFPFMSTGVGANDLQERCQRGLGRLPLHKPSPITNVFSAECNSSILNNTHEHTAERMGSEALLGEHELEQTEDLNHTVGAVSGVCSSETRYRLVAVVEHFGRVGSGHYTVYRSVRSESDSDYTSEGVNGVSLQWFCISDSEVGRVLEKDVLAAEASLLFYEKITES